MNQQITNRAVGGTNGEQKAYAINEVGKMVVLKTDRQELEVKVGSHVYFSSSDSFIEWSTLSPALQKLFSKLESVIETIIDLYQTKPRERPKH